MAHAALGFGCGSSPCLNTSSQKHSEKAHRAPTIFFIIKIDIVYLSFTMPPELEPAVDALGVLTLAMGTTEEWALQ